MYILLLLILSILPVCLLGLYIYRKDQNREPVRLLVKLFLGGVAAVFLTWLISWVMEIFLPFFASETEALGIFELLIYVFFGVAVVEEFSKWIISRRLAWRSEEFDESFDAIVYCTFVGLGFACLENIIYVLTEGLTTAILRAILAVPGHFCYGIIMGYYFGRAKIASLHGEKKQQKKQMALSLVVPTVMHGIYDFCLFSGNLLLLLIFLIFVVAMFVWSFRRIRKESTENRSFFGTAESQNMQSFTQEELEQRASACYCVNCGQQFVGNFCPYCGQQNVLSDGELTTQK